MMTLDAETAEKLESVLESALNPTGPAFADKVAAMAVRRDLFLALPEWLHISWGDFRFLAKQAMEGLEPGKYRAYAVRDTDRNVVAVVFRPYYGGIWFPSPMECKIMDVTL